MAAWSWRSAPRLALQSPLEGQVWGWRTARQSLRALPVPGTPGQAPAQGAQDNLRI